MAAPPGQRLFPVGFEVLCTAVHASEREQMQAVAKEHGIELTASVRKTPPHVVITRSVKSHKYRAVMRSNPYVPVVTPDWLLASARQGTRLGYDGYRVGPFTGLTICFSGISAHKKQALARQVQGVGGQHSAALDKRCTHLVTTSTESEKYKFARREGIICVQPKWVEECISKGWCQEEAAFLVVEAGDDSAQNRGGDLMPLRSGACGLLGEETTMLSLPAPSSAHGGVSESRATAAAAEPSCGAVRGREVSQPPQQAQAQRPPPSRLQRDSAAAQPPAAPRIQLSPFAEAPPSYDDLDWDDDTPMFLDSCRIHLAGCTPAEQVEMLRVVREGAAKRLAALGPGLSHIVVGSDLTAVEAAELADYSASNRQAACVTLDWLRRCGAKRERLPADDRFLIPISILQGYKKKVPAVEQAEADARLQHSGSQSFSEETAFTRQPSSVVTGPLADCYFTLSALRWSGFAREEEQQVKDLILHNGGRVFSALTISTVTDKSKAFAICPPSLLASEVVQLRTSYPDFKLVDEKQRFTPYWLECSLIAQRPLAAQRGAPLYQPLPYPLPLVGMDRVSVCVSGYDQAVRGVIQRTLQLLGGTTSENMSKHNTHLILPEAAGAKYHSCGRMRVHPVTADWLLDSIAYGRLQPEGNYAPLLPEGLFAEQPHSSMRSEDGAATRSGCGTGLGTASQIGVTQFPGSAAPPTSRYHAAASGDGSAHGGEQQLAAGAAALTRGAAGGSQQQRALRDRMTWGGSTAKPGPAGTPLRHSNDENAPAAAPTLMDADMAVPAWGTLVGQHQPPHEQQQQQQPSLLDAMLDEGGVCRVGGSGRNGTGQGSMGPAEQQQRSLLDDALDGLGAAPAQQPAQQAQQSLFDHIFGSSSPPASHPQSRQRQSGVGAPVAVRGQGGVPLVPSPASGCASNGSSGRRSSGKGSKGRGRSGASRLRPDPCAVAAMAAAEAALEYMAPASVEAELDQKGDAVSADRPQEQEGGGEGAEFELMVDRIGGLLARVAQDQPMLGSQQDMPPPPPRGRGAKRPAGGDDTESTMSNGSDEGGGRQTRARAKRHNTPSTGGTGSGRAPRRSGRGAKAELVEVDMSQQVGYDASPTLLPTRATRGASSTADAAAAKQKLRQMADAARQRGARSKDIFSEMGL